METLVSLEQSENTLNPMLVTLSGMETLVREESENAKSPMLVTLSGMETLVRLEQ